MIPSPSSTPRSHTSLVLVPDLINASPDITDLDLGSLFTEDDQGIQVSGGVGLVY